MTNEFSKYEAMKRSGATPEQVYLEASNDGVDNITRVRLVRSVFSLALKEYKDVWARAEGIADSLHEHAEILASNLEIRFGLKEKEGMGVVCPPKTDP